MNPNELGQSIEDETEVVEIEEVEDVDESNDESTEPEESVADLKKKLATIEAQKEHWREKANKKPAEELSNSNLSSSDLLAVMKANVHEDDMERVERFARSEGQSIKDALKNPELTAILNLREESRTTASVANVTNSRRGSTKLSAEAMINNASKGKLPEDDDGIEALVAAKRKLK